MEIRRGLQASNTEQVNNSETSRVLKDSDVFKTGF